MHIAEVHLYSHFISSRCALGDELAPVVEALLSCDFGKSTQTIQGVLECLERYWPTKISQHFIAFSRNRSKGFAASDKFRYIIK
jgi:hypothetical protein